LLARPSIRSRSAGFILIETTFVIPG
jgi:hypothetical protein